MNRRPIILILLALAPIFAGAAPHTRQFASDLASARLLLDVGKTADAAAAFERLAAKFPREVEEFAPDRAWAYAMLGNDELAAKHYEDAARYYAFSHAICPGFLETYRQEWAYCRLIRFNDDVAAANKNPRNADLAALEKDARWILNIAPENAQAHFSAGLVYDAENKKDEARDEYLKALGDSYYGSASLGHLREAARQHTNDTRYVFNMHPPCPLWEKADPGAWQILKRGPFIIYHHNEELAERVAAALDYYLTLPVLNGVLPADGPFPPECKVYIFADDKSFMSSGGKQVWAGGQSNIVLEDGKLKSASIQLYQTSPDLTESSVPHELAHVRLVASAHFYEGLPLWIQEGVATSTEFPMKKERLADSMADAFDRDGLIPVSKLMRMTTYPEDSQSDLYYAESAAIVEALVKRYSAERFSHFIAALEKQPQAEALKRVYGISSTDVERLVLQWISAHK